MPECPECGGPVLVSTNYGQTFRCAQMHEWSPGGDEDPYDRVKEMYETLWDTLDDLDPTRSPEEARYAGALEDLLRKTEKDLRSTDEQWLHAYQAQVGL